MTNNMMRPGDRVLYRGPRTELWGEVAVVKGHNSYGETKLQFKSEPKLVHACPGELTHCQ